MTASKTCLLLLLSFICILAPAPALADDWATDQAVQDPAEAAAEPSEDAPLAPLPTEEVVMSQVAPVILKIPSIGVDATVVPVGMDEDGAMSTPPHPDTVAWWSLGYGTGVVGNVVLAAHINWGGVPRVFGQLDQLQSGDQVVVVDEQLREYRYEVTSTNWVVAEGAPVEEIFAASDVPELTLITCGGRYVAATREYLDRLIVRARQI